MTDLSAIPSGSILLASGKRFLSRLIGRFTSSSWTHCGLILDIEGQTTLVEAVTPEVRCVPLDRWLAQYPGIAAYGVHDQVGSHNIDAIRSHALGLCGRPYDVHRLFELAVDIPFDMKNESDALPGHDDRFICSRIVYECFLAGGVRLTTRGGYVTPSSIAREVEIMERLTC